MESRQIIETLFNNVEGSFSKELGIDLSSLDKDELFKWLLASKFFGARINESVGKKTYKTFLAKKLDTVSGILDADDSYIIRALDTGGFGKNDIDTAHNLKAMSSRILNEYKGDLNNLHKAALSSADLEQRLSSLEGIGPITTKVFLRELRGLWEKATPLPAHSTACSARRLGLTRVLAKNDEDLINVLTLLGKFWEKTDLPGKDFADFEVALFRQGKSYCLKGKCLHCSLAVYCRYYTDQS